MPVRIQDGEAAWQGNSPDTHRAEDPAAPYGEIADDLRGAIRTGILNSGDVLPTVKELSARYKPPRLQLSELSNCSKAKG